MFTAEAFTALFSVIAIDLALAGDNAVVIGLAAAGLEPRQRGKAILIGIALAALLRILLSIFTMQLLHVIGLMFAGGLLLLWVCWKLWRELRQGAGEDDADAAGRAPKSFRAAILQIVLADISMSLDNVLAVAGAAHDHLWVLVIGLALSIALTGFAANLIARLLQRHRWIGYLGLAIILVVALRMIWDGVPPLLALLNA